MAILAIVFSIAFPVMHNLFEHHNLEAACYLLQQDIRWASQQALAKESADYQVNIYISTEKYRIDDISQPGYLKTVNMPESVDIVWTNFPDDLIRFSPKGTPTRGGHIRLQGSSTGETRYVIITPVTGRIRVSDQPPINNQ